MKIFKKALVLIGITAMSIAIFVGCTKEKEYSIGINVPPGTDGMVYSDVEIIAQKKKITISAGKNLPETDVTLVPTESKTQTAYKSFHMRTDLPYNINIEKGAKFKIGVDIQNESEEKVVVYVNVRNVDVCNN